MGVARVPVLPGPFSGKQASGLELDSFDSVHESQSRSLFIIKETESNGSSLDRHGEVFGLQRGMWLALAQELEHSQHPDQN